MSNLRNVLDLYRVNNNIYKCLSDIAFKLARDDNITESIAEELLDETIKYLSFIQRRLDEISVNTVVDKPQQAL